MVSALWAATLISLPQAAAPQARNTPAVPLTPTDAGTVVSKFCVGCHNERTKTGGLVLEGIDFTKAAANAGALEKVVRKLGTGSMPPQGMPRPDAATHDALLSFLIGELDRAAAARPDPGAPSFAA